MKQYVYEELNRLENKHWWFCARRLYLEKIIGDLFLSKQKDLSFCEIGSGTGGNLPLLTKFAQVDSVEMNDIARSLIKEKAVPNVRNVYPGYLPNNMCHVEEYDAVFSLDVIEHIENDHAALVRIKDYLKQDGLFITTVPAYQWLWSAHDDANHHFRRYTKKAYAESLKSAGYEVIYSSYFNTLLFPLAAISRLSENFLRKNKALENVTIKMPGKLSNKLLKNIFSVEKYWAGKFEIPFGLSIIIIAKKYQ